MADANLQKAVNNDERRIAPRVRTLKRARVLFNNRFSTIDCIVRNVSVTGALLTVDSAVHLPKTFEICIGEEGTIRPAKLVYRREMFAGIHFLDAAPDEDMSPLPRLREEAVAQADGEAISIHRIQHAPLPPALVQAFVWNR